MNREEPTERVRPFSQGTQAMDWMEGNCWICERERTCAMRADLYRAMNGDGAVARSTADAMGVPRNTWSDWTCREFKPARPE